MKKILFLLLTLFSVVSYAQADFPEGVQISGGQPTTTAPPYVTTTNSDGLQGKISPENIPINQPPHPINYTAPTATLGGHLIGIDTRLGQIGQTTAGQTNRIYFTGDDTTVNSIVYFASNASGKGSTPSASPPNLVNGDNTKQYFTKDIIGIAQPANTISAPGIYSGQLSVMVDSDIAQERYTIEVYKTDNLGVPIASGITGATVGDLGVTVITILDSGVLDLSASAVTNITVSGILTEQLTLNTGERVRYHVSAAKVGTAGSNVTFTVYYGSNYSSYYDVPVTTTTDGVVNKSTVTGLTTSDALDALSNYGLPEILNNEFTANNKIFLADGSVDLSSIDVTTVPSILTTKPKILIARTTDLATTVSEHGFGDNSIFDSNNTAAAYNSYDAFININGTLAKDHYLGYQQRSVYNGSGTLNFYQGYRDAPKFTNGTVQRRFGFRVSNPALSGSAVLERNIGLKIEALSGGTIENFAIQTDGSTPSSFGGTVTAGAFTTTGALTAASIIKTGATGTDILLGDNTTLSTNNVHQIRGTYGAGGESIDNMTTDGIYFLSGSSTGTKPAFTARIVETLRAGVSSANITQVAWHMSSGRMASRSSSDSGATWSSWLEYANVDSQTFTGNPTAPTPTAGDNDTSIATTAFVNGVATSGTFTPTITPVLNVTTATLNSATYTRIGNIVTARYGFDLTVTSTNTVSEISLTFPVNRSVTTTVDIGGGSVLNPGTVQSVVACSSTTANIIKCLFFSSANGASKCNIVVQYSIN